MSSKSAHLWRVVGPLVLSSCVPALVNGVAGEANIALPEEFAGADGGASAADLPWDTFFVDAKLRQLIGDALSRNQEFKMVALEIELAQSEALARRGEIFPKLGLRAGAGVGRNGGLTSSGVSDDAHGLPAHLGEFNLSLAASWEIDIWGKLRSASKAAVARYLASTEGKKFAATALVAEVANAYYELLALDAQLAVLKETVALQQDALEAVKLQKAAARVTELAVKRFEAEVAKNQSRQFSLEQAIVQAENHINFLCGHLPGRIERGEQDFVAMSPADVPVGLPSALLMNRPDIRQAELSLQATAFDTKSARAAFFPSLGISIQGGYQAYDLLRLFSTPLSLFYDAGADVFAPLLNRTALTAAYASANARQKQAVLNYEKTILNGYIEVANQISAVANVERGYAQRARELSFLQESTRIASSLFASARADYTEVLLTRRDALESQMELIELKRQRLIAAVNLYRALGGGWQAKAEGDAAKSGAAGAAPVR